MPPKRKAAKSKAAANKAESIDARVEKKARLEEETSENVDGHEETPIEEQPDEHDEQIESEKEDQADKSSAMAARFKKLQELKRRRVSSTLQSVCLSYVLFMSCY